MAAGPWTPGIVDPSGAWRPIAPRWGVVLPVTLAAPPSRVLEEAEISIEPGVEDDGEAGHAFSLVTAEGVSSLGSTFLADEPDAASLVPSLIRRGIRFVPAIAMRRSGRRASAPDPRAWTVDRSSARSPEPRACGSPPVMVRGGSPPARHRAA